MATFLQIHVHCFSNRALSSPPTPLQNRQINRFRVKAVKEKIEEIKTPPSTDEITKKYGLEAGLWKIFSSEGGKKSKGDEAKQLLAKYGGAYLATSITLSLISFGLCYALINAGVDVPALLQKVFYQINLY